MVIAGIADTVASIIVVTFLFGGWAIVRIVNSMSENWRRVRESEHQASLKQSMIEKGMSADDVERVLRARPEPSAEQAEKHATTDPAVLLNTTLAAHEVPAKKMEEILAVFYAADPEVQTRLARSVASMLDTVAENGVVVAADIERVLVAVRSLCRSTSAGEQGYEGGFVGEAPPARRNFF